MSLHECMSLYVIVAWQLIQFYIKKVLSVTIRLGRFRQIWFPDQYLLRNWWPGLENYVMRPKSKLGKQWKQWKEGKSATQGRQDWLRQEDTKEALTRGYQNLIAAVRSSHVTYGPMVFHSQQAPDARIVFRVLPGKRLTWTAWCT